MNQKKNILVTGANGLLGKAAVKYFSASHSVHAVVRSMPEHKVEGVQYHIIDLSDAGWPVASLPDNVDTVFHLAQSSKFREFPDQALDIFRVNVDSTAKLLDYAKNTGAKRFVYASSGGVYGSGDALFRESLHIPLPPKLGGYIGSKICGEVLCDTYSSILTTCILRFFFIYGAEQNRSMLLPRLVDNVMNQRPISIQGEAGIAINPVHVSDAVRSLALMLDAKESCCVNVGGSEVVTIRRVAELIGEITGKEPLFEKVSGEPKNLVADIDVLKAMGARPEMTLAEGLRDLL